MGKLIDFETEADRIRNKKMVSVHKDEQMTKNAAIIKEIVGILKDAKIRRYEDIKNLTLDKSKLLSAQRYPWIGDVAELVNTLYYSAEKHIGDVDGQVFLIDKIGSSNYKNVMKYSCVFPNRTVMSSGDFFFLNKKEYAFIDIDFFYKLFSCKNVLLEGIIHIAPFYLFTDIEEGAADYDNCMIESLTLPDKNKKKIAELDKCGLGMYQGNHLLNELFVTMPWLENARVEDYIDIVNKYKAEFDHYNCCLANISEVTEDTEAFMKKYLTNYKEANIDLRIAMEKKQAELKSKGITTTLSLCMTVIPYLLPEGCVDPQIVSAFLGTATIKEALNNANIFTEKRNIGKESPFWVLWKWENIHHL